MFNLVLGHLIGDYLLQSEAMAKKKSIKTLEGFLICIFHCILYTTFLVILCNNKTVLFISLIFLSHFLIDRYSLADKWLALIRGRRILAANNSSSDYKMIDVAFACIIYTVVDNTFHLLIAWELLKILPR